jgi:hypothetical protein
MELHYPLDDLTSLKGNVHMSLLSLVRTVIRPVVRFFTRISDRITHTLIFKNSLTLGAVTFHGLNEEGDVDVYVILQDLYFKKPAIYGVHFANRYMMQETAHARCAVIWRECMSMDGVRPICVLEGDRQITPYTSPQPIHRRIQQLFKSAQSESADEVMA